MKITKDDQLVTTLNTAKTIQVFTDMLEELKVAEVAVQQENRATVLAQRLKRDEFVAVILRNKWIEEFNLSLRDEEVKRIKGVYERSIANVRIPRLFGRQEALDDIANYQVLMADEIDKVSKRVPISYEERDKSFKHNSSDFNDFIKKKLGSGWVGIEIEIKTLLTTEESIRTLIRKLKCIHDESFAANDFPADFNLKYGWENVNIWEYKL